MHSAALHAGNFAVRSYLSVNFLDSQLSPFTSPCAAFEKSNRRTNSIRTDFMRQVFIEKPIFAHLVRIPGLFMEFGDYHVHSISH
jgi:hypothetical protein